MVRKHGCKQKCASDGDVDVDGDEEQDDAIAADDTPAVSGHGNSKQLKCNLCFSFFATQGNLRKHYYLRHWTKSNRAPPSSTSSNGALIKQRYGKPTHSVPANWSAPTSGAAQELFKFKCHHCDDRRFSDRRKCLKHLQIAHADEYKLLLSKGAVDQVDNSETKSMLADNVADGKVNNKDLREL